MTKQALSLFIILSVWFFYTPYYGFAQLDKIEQNVDKKIESQKKQKESAPKTDEKDTPPKTENKPTPQQGKVSSDGRAIFSYDPEIDDDFGFVNSGGVVSAKPNEEKSDLPDAARGLDTTAFMDRMSAVKRRDMIRYRDGLKDKAPIINTEKYSTKRTLKKGIKVFGWHPHWMANAYESYNFSLLSMIAYFSYELNPSDGTYRSIHDWNTTPLIEKAQAQGVKVLLSVSNFGQKNNDTFLTNRLAQRTCINSIIQLLKARNADGVHLDFENIPKNRSEEFTNFVLDMTSQVKAAIEGGIVTISVPTIDFERVVDMNQLKNQIDFFIMGGYEFYGSNSPTAGPISAVAGGSYWWKTGLEDAVDDYLAAGLAPEKLILTVPYYGAAWNTESLQIPASSKKFIDYTMYRDIARQRLKAVNEPSSMSAYIAYREGNNYRQIWFEDSTSLAQKYAWIQSKKIGGAAIWALGYDNGTTKLWEALAGQLAEPIAAKKATAAANASWFRRIMMPAMRIAQNPQLLIRNPQYLFTMFGALTGISMIGFLVLYRYGCRMKRTFNLGIKGLLAFILFSLLVITVIGMGNFDSTYLKAAAFLIGGFIIGAIVFLFLSRRFISEREMP